MSEIVRIDDLEVQVRRSPRRKTVDLIVDRFGDLVISVPESLPEREVEAIVRRKQEWIYGKLEHKDAVLKPTGTREFVTGEGFYYLGRKYRLKLIDSAEAPQAPTLSLRNSRFWMLRSAAEKGRSHFIRWYTQRGEAWIPDAVQKLKDRVAAEPRAIVVRDLKYRWASCNALGDVYFHWRIMLLPPKVIHYLILHELVHLYEHNHSAAFYERLGRAVPAYRQIESWLEAHGDSYDL